jgi:hypothetical protein
MFATGTAGPVGLVSTEPPLSPETIGRAPSNFDPPVPLVSLEELVGLDKRQAPAAAPAEPEAVAEARRVVLRLAGGEELELGAYDSKDEAVARAQELIALVDAAEERGEWPEVGDRMVRPASIVSVDLLAPGAAG